MSFSSSESKNNLREWLNKNLNVLQQSQRYSFPIAIQFLIQNNDFILTKIDSFNELFIILCKLDQIDSAILPVFHDWPLEASEIQIFTEKYSSLLTLLALCAPDGSCILYKSNIFDISKINEEQGDGSDSG